MRILVDENIPLMTVVSLRCLGHDVRDVRGSSEQGKPDADLWALAQREERLVISTDKGFAARRDRRHFGAMVVRLRRPNRRRIHERVLYALAAIAEKDWLGRVVTLRDRVMSVWPAGQP